MLRIVDGIVYEGKPSNTRWLVTINNLGHGQKEACAQRPIEWVESGPLHPDSIAAKVLRGEMEDPQAAEKAEANRKRSARRAKTRVRRLCKAQGFDTMATLTYRANQTDLALCKRHVKEFVRRLRRTIPTFAFVGAFEPQKRGAWHCHMGVHRVQPSFIVKGVRVKSYDLFRSVWRSVVGDLGGTVNMGNAKGWKRYSPGRLASYLSKYMLKAFEQGEDWSNRYTASEGFKLPDKVKIEFVGEALAGIVDLVYGEVAEGRRECFTWLSRFGDTFFIATEPDPGGPAAYWERG